MEESIFSCARCKMPFVDESAKIDCMICSDTCCDECVTEEGVCTACGGLAELGVSPGEAVAV